MLLHIISMPNLDAAWESGQIAPDSLATEGFVHCSYPEQVLTPANARYASQTNLVLLVLNAEAIPHQLVVEDSYGSGTEFPHIYGPIPAAAIERVVPFPPNPDGTFDLPELAL